MDLLQTLDVRCVDPVLHSPPEASERVRVADAADFSPPPAHYPVVGTLIQIEKEKCMC